MTGTMPGWERDIDSRMALVEQETKNLKTETNRHRERLHTLESSYRAIELLIQEVAHTRAELTAGMNSLRVELHAFTEERVRAAVDAAFVRHADTSNRAWDNRTKILMVLIALAGWLTAAAQLPAGGSGQPEPLQIVTVTTP